MADLVHAHAVQFAKPGVSIEFDTDQKQAIATRRSIIKAIADGKGRYSWVPEVLSESWECPRCGVGKQLFEEMIARVTELSQVQT